MQVVLIGNLKSGMVLGRTIIGNQGQILLRQGVSLTESHIKYLKKYPLEAVYISTGEDVVPKDVISDEIRLQAIRETRDVLLQVKRGAELELEKVNEVLIAVIDELLLQDEIMINLIDLRAFSEDLFSHSVNVAVLSLIIGLEYNYDIKSLKKLALAGLLHDIGYLFVPEGRAIAHVQLGMDSLYKSALSRSILESISHHHERWDGKGYPNRLKGTEINELARIIQVANIFDRLSANNQYPMDEVIEYLMAKSGEEFEPRSVRKFINCVSFYPVGTKVELNTGESGIVIKANKGFPTRPVVQIKRNMYGNIVEQGYVVNLIEKTTYFVIRRLNTTPDQGD